MPELSAEELDITYQIRKALDATHMDLAELPAECERLKLRVRQLIGERDSARFRADQKWRCRKEIHAALDISEDMDADEALRSALAKIKEMQSPDLRTFYVYESGMRNAALIAQKVKAPASIGRDKGRHHEAGAQAAAKAILEAIEG